MSKRAPVTAAMIVKDDARALDALRSVAPYVKEVVIVCNGSDEDFERVAKAGDGRFDTDLQLRHVTSHNDANGELFDFAALRNETLRLATQPWYMWLDSDDVVDGAEHLADEIDVLESNRKAAHLLDPNLEIEGKYPYWYRIDGNGRPTLITPTPRIISNPSAWQWYWPCHESLVLKDASKGILQVSRDTVIWKHLSNDAHGDRNLRILSRYMLACHEKGEKPASRMLFYFGNELAHASARVTTQEEKTKHAEAAVDAFRQHMADPHIWQDERYESAMQCSRIYLRSGQFEEALHYASMAMVTNETFHEAYLQMAQIYEYRNGPRDAERVLFACKLALESTGSLGLWSETDWRYWAYYRQVIAFMRLERYTEAVAAGVAALTIHPEQAHPNHHNLGFNVALAQLRSLKTRLATLHVELQQLADFGHTGLNEELKSMPQWPQTAPVSALKSQVLVPTPWIQDARLAAVAAVDRHLTEAHLQRVNENVAAAVGVERKPYEPPSIRTLWKPLDIVFLCGRSWEPWDPEIVSQGMGGSETAVVEMARRLAKRSHRVTVRTESAGREDVYEGVRYTSAGGGAYDVAIAWRYADQLVTLHETPSKPMRKVLWVHDTQAVNEGPSLEYVRRADTIFALSEWHKQTLVGRGYPQERIVVTRNGVNPNLFSMQRVERDPYTVVYSSSPDRGLLSLLQMWPRIVEQEPKASLVIAYGFDGWDKNRGAAWPCDDATRAHCKELVFDLERTGSVEYIGRVSKSRLAAVMLGAGVLALPTWFTETYCITLDEAFCAGLEVVTSPIAALAERGGWHGPGGNSDYARFVEGDWLSKPYQDRFVSEVLEAMRDAADPAYQTIRDRKMREAQQRYDWEGVVDQWEQVFGLEPKTSARFRQMRDGTQAQGVQGAASDGMQEDAGNGPKGPPLPPPPGAVGANGPEHEARAYNFRWQPDGPQYGKFSTRRRIHFVLDSALFRPEEHPIDPVHPFATNVRGGSRVGFMGLALAMGKLEGWNVWAWSRFTCEETVEAEDARRFSGVRCRQYSDEALRAALQPGDVVFAFYSNKPLATLGDNVLRIASHHSYSPPYDAVTGDIHTAPSEHAIASLQAVASQHSASFGKFWRKLSNGVGDRPVVRRPVPGRVLYHASPDRGLHHLLEMWPEVRKAVPHATLHVVGDVAGWLRNPRPDIWGDRQERTLRALERLETESKAHFATKPTLLGELSFDALMKEFGEASLFAYPCDPVAPCETFSISVMECLKVGVPVLLREVDSLGEVYEQASLLAYGKLGAGYWGISPERPYFRNPWESAFEEQLVCLVRDSRGIECAPQIQEWAASFTFEKEAARLVEIIGEYEEHRRATEPDRFARALGKTIDDYYATKEIPTRAERKSSKAFGDQPATCESLTRVLVEAHRQPKPPPWDAVLITPHSGPSAGMMRDVSLYIPSHPPKTHEICRKLSQSVFDGEYDHPALDATADSCKGVLDLGCGWGAFLVWAAKKWPNASRTGYDPHAKALEYARVNDPVAFSLRQAAVTTQPSLKIHLEEDWGHIRAVKGETEVPVVHPKDLPPCDVLKIDTEGCDLEILQAYPHLAGVKVLLFEYHYQAHRWPMMQIAKEAGFTFLRETTPNYHFGTVVCVRKSARWFGVDDQQKSWSPVKEMQS